MRLDQLTSSGRTWQLMSARSVAVDNPKTVHGLLDLSPSSTVNCSYIPSTHLQCPKPPAWLRNGKPVPHTAQWSDPAPTDVPTADIPVEKITGPVLTLCGGSDLLWNSCRYSDAIQQRLQTKGARYPRLQLSYPDAGHGIDFPAPYIPAIETTSSEQIHGTTPNANELARADAWPKVLQFIDHPS